MKSVQSKNSGAIDPPPPAAPADEHIGEELVAGDLADQDSEADLRDAEEAERRLADPNVLSFLSSRRFEHPGEGSWLTPSALRNRRGKSWRRFLKSIESESNAAS